MTKHLTWMLLLGLLAFGCTTQPGDDDDDDSADDDDASDDDAGDDDTANPGSVNGVVIRDTTLLAEGDGIGTLCIGVLYSCTEGADIVGIQLDDIDLSDKAIPVPFSMEVQDVLDTGSTYYMGALFSEEPIDCVDYEMQGGEMVNGDCPQFVFDENAPTEGIEIYLTTKMAWPA